MNYNVRIGVIGRKTFRLMTVSLIDSMAAAFESWNHKPHAIYQNGSRAHTQREDCACTHPEGLAVEVADRHALAHLGPPREDDVARAGGDYSRVPATVQRPCQTISQSAKVRQSRPTESIGVALTGQQSQGVG